MTLESLNPVEMFKSHSEEEVSNLTLNPVQSNIAVEVRFRELLPFYTIKAACGYFGEGEAYKEDGWVRADSLGRLNRKMFVIRASGNSISPRIKDGDYCVFSNTVHG